MGKYRATKTQRHPVKVKMETERGTWIVVIDRGEVRIKPYRAGWDTAAHIRPHNLYVAAQQYEGITERERNVRGEPAI